MSTPPCLSGCDACLWCVAGALGAALEKLEQMPDLYYCLAVMKSVELMNKVIDETGDTEAGVIASELFLIRLAEEGSNEYLV